jgi:ATP-dependent Lhr-like helicase
MPAVEKTNNNNALSLFHPLIARWFTESIGDPTRLQALVWPRIASGEHILATAPTGSGKTFAAFLWSLNQLITGAWTGGKTRVLYVSPLKALNNDIRRNLSLPLITLRRLFAREGEEFPDIRVETRSGDTPQSERRRMLRRPPEILVTTPESLNLLLSSAGGRSLLTQLETVILDEIHGVVSSKRGVHLMTAVERLTGFSGEFQRIALSATVSPMETVARYVGGFRMEGARGNRRFIPREVAQISDPSHKVYEIRASVPDNSRETAPGDDFWHPLAESCRKIIREHRSTLIFVNNRRLCEKLTHKINQGEEAALAYAHHGSLSREIRQDVEKRLKTGRLRAIVATHSLELGIDIGSLDRVILIQSPSSVASAVQRAGRAGHGVGQVSRAVIYPTHDHDFLEAAVTARGMVNQDIEDVKPIRNPLDVLAQVLVSMTGLEIWDLDDLYDTIRMAEPYRHLTRSQFDSVVHMLAGRYAGSRVRELQPRLSIDRSENTVTGRKGSLLSLYASGGTIPDRGYFHLRHQQSGARIGELDEEFVWENPAGRTFTMGAQTWTISRITHNDVFVTQGRSSTLTLPFWKGEPRSRSSGLSLLITEFLTKANSRLDNPDFLQELEKEYAMQPEAARRLIRYLKEQRLTTGTDLPNRHHLVAEQVRSGPGGSPGNQVILHTFWGGQLNRPWAMALEAAWESRFGHRIETFATNDAVILQLAGETPVENITTLVTSAGLESLLRRTLESSGLFGARFRECAYRSLILSKGSFHRRMPLWMSRLRSQKLLQAVRNFSDFPVLLETWRTCLQDEFDLPALRDRLDEISSGNIRVSTCETAVASPMARQSTWRQINQYMYATDVPVSREPSSLKISLIREAALTPELRPALPESLISDFISRRQRLFPGYAPSGSRDLLDWIVERIVIPEPEWNALLHSMEKQHGSEIPVWIKQISRKLCRLLPDKADTLLMAARDRLPEICKTWYPFLRSRDVLPFSIGDPAVVRAAGQISSDEIGFASLLREWLTFYGPVKPEFIQECLGLDQDRLKAGLDDLMDTEHLISGTLTEGKPDFQVCDTENFESMLRMKRARAKPELQPLPLRRLPLFLARYQGLVHRNDSIEGLYECMERLLGFPAQADLWETALLPARLPSYQTGWMDMLIQENGLIWLGRGKGRILFFFPQDLDLLELPNPGAGRKKPLPQALANLFSDPSGRYPLSALLEKTGEFTSDLVRSLWSEVWRGSVTNDTFHAIRRGLETGFHEPDVLTGESAVRSGGRGMGHRGRFARWKQAMPYAGNWYRTPGFSPDNAPLAREERNRERVRLLLERYGVVFRELLQRELPAFQWPRVFRTLRLMELAGEAVAGYFFQDIPGPQFASPRALQLLREPPNEEPTFWINASDPASVCGLPLSQVQSPLPRRLPGNFLVYRGTDPVLIAENQGKRLNFLIGPDAESLSDCLALLRYLLYRPVLPRKRLTVESINGKAAASSPYAPALETIFDTVKDYKRLICYRKAGLTT